MSANGYYSPEPIIVLGPCPDCGRHVDIAKVHLDAIARLVEPAKPAAEAILVLDLDAFGETDWTKELVSPTDLARVVTASEWIEVGLN